MSSQPNMTKEQIRQSLDTLERFYDPVTGKIDGHAMMGRIKELEAENKDLRRQLAAAIEWIQEDCPYSEDTIREELSCSLLRPQA